MNTMYYYYHDDSRREVLLRVKQQFVCSSLAGGPRPPRGGGTCWRGCCPVERPWTRSRWRLLCWLLYTTPFLMKCCLINTYNNNVYVYFVVLGERQVHPSIQGGCIQKPILKVHLQTISVHFLTTIFMNVFTCFWSHYRLTMSHSR